jgi:hypothetical protein
MDCSMKTSTPERKCNWALTTDANSSELDSVVRDLSQYTNYATVFSWEQWLDSPIHQMVPVPSFHFSCQGAHLQIRRGRHISRVQAASKLLHITTNIYTHMCAWSWITVNFHAIRGKFIFILIPYNQNNMAPVRISVMLVVLGILRKICNF